MASTLSVTSGLVGWYKGEEWNGISWPDLSGNGNDCTEIKGFIKKEARYIYGTTADGLRFPTSILPSTYTLFHVARYNGPSRNRIFDGVTKNWLSGFWGSQTRVAYHSGWVTNSSRPSTEQVNDVMISTDQRNLFRSNGVDYTTGSGNDYDRLSINYGAHNAEASHWAVAEVIVYNRQLSLSEIQSVESYLTARHSEVDLASVQSILGGENPIGINEYYGTSGYVPSSSTIGLNHFLKFSQTPITAIPAKNLQVYLSAYDARSYPKGGGGNTWYDISGNNRHGTWTAASYVFDSRQSYFDTNGRSCSGPPSDSFGITETSGYTVFILMYQYSLVNTESFKFHGNGGSNRAIFSHATWSNGRVYFDQGGCCGSDTRLDVELPNPTGTWHTIAFVREANSSTRHIYIDGTLSATNTSAAANLQLNSTPVAYVSGTTWNARLAAFLAYNRHLSGTEIAILHRHVTFGTIPNPPRPPAALTYEYNNLSNIPGSSMVYGTTRIYVYETITLPSGFSTSSSKFRVGVTMSGTLRYGPEQYITCGLLKSDDSASCAVDMSAGWSGNQPSWWSYDGNTTYTNAYRETRTMNNGNLVAGDTVKLRLTVYNSYWMYNHSCKIEIDF